MREFSAQRFNQERPLNITESTEPTTFVENRRVNLKNRNKNWQRSHSDIQTNTPSRQNTNGHVDSRNLDSVSRSNSFVGRNDQFERSYF